MEEELRTFIFSSKNSSASVVISAKSFEEAEKEIEEYGGSWSCDDIEGEKE